MGEGSPLYDPGSESYYLEGESSASITINGMGKRKEVKSIAAAVKIRYPSKLHRSTRSGPIAVYYAIGTCTTSLITGQYEMIVIDFAEFLSEWWFPLCTNPGRADQPKVGLHCEGWYRGTGQMKCPRTAGLGYTNKNSAAARVAPFVPNRKFLEGFLNRG